MAQKWFKSEITQTFYKGFCDEISPNFKIECEERVAQESKMTAWLRSRIEDVDWRKRFRKCTTNFSSYVKKCYKHTLKAKKWTGSDRKDHATVGNCYQSAIVDTWACKDKVKDAKDKAHSDYQVELAKTARIKAEKEEKAAIAARKKALKAAEKAKKEKEAIEKELKARKEKAEADRKAKAEAAKKEKAEAEKKAKEEAEKKAKVEAEKKEKEEAEKKDETEKVDKKEKAEAADKKDQTKADNKDENDS